MESPSQHNAELLIRTHHPSNNSAFVSPNDTFPSPSNPMESLQIARTSSSGIIDTKFHGSCHECHHWYDGEPFTISTRPGVFNGVRCTKCGKKMFGIGGNSTHTSLASQETISIQPFTYGSDTSSLHHEVQPGESSVDPLPETPRLRLSTLAESADTRVGETTEDRPRSRGRIKSNSQTPSPRHDLLSPESAVGDAPLRDRSHSAPPHPSLVSPSPPQRSSSFRDKIKKYAKRTANHFGYDLVKLPSPTTPDGLNDGKVYISISHGDSPTSLGSIPNPANVPLPPSPDLRQLAPGSRPSTPMRLYQHSEGHTASSPGAVRQRRRERVGAPEQSLRLQPLTDRSPRQTPHDLSEIFEHRHNDDLIGEGPFDSEGGGQAYVLSTGPSQWSLSNMNHSHLSLLADSNLSTRLSSRLLSPDHGQISSATTIVNPSDSEDASTSSSRHFSASNLVHWPYPTISPVESPRVSLSYPYPPRISTDFSVAGSDASEGHSYSERQHMNELEEDDGGRTPIAGSITPRRHPALLPEPVSPEDIRDAANMRSRDGTNEPRASIDNDSITATYGSAHDQNE